MCERQTGRACGIVLITLLLFGVGRPALGYIPGSTMILQRVTSNHGKGIYIIDNEVQFPKENGTLTVREQWLVFGDDLMKLSAHGGKGLEEVHYDNIYQKQKKFFVREKDKVLVRKLDRSWPEFVFHCRTVDAMVEILKSMSILPQSYQNGQKAVKVGGVYSYPHEKWLHLFRTSGVVTYNFGKLTPVDTEKKEPGLWVEQDQFFIRRIRWLNGVEIFANNYVRHSGGLWLPKTRLVMWKGNKVQIRTIKVRRISDTQRNRNKFKIKMIKNKLTIEAQDPVVREFYSRFR